MGNTATAQLSCDAVSVGSGSSRSSFSSSSSSKTSKVDACYALCRVDILQRCILDHDVIIHTYDQYAPMWCDIFDFHVRPDRSWFPLEQLDGTAAARDKEGEGPGAALLSAYRARTVQERAAAVAAVMARGGPDAIDARLLLAELPPHKPHSAKRKLLQAVAAVAVAAAAEEQAGVSPGAKALAAALGVVHQRDDGSFIYFLGPRARAGVRATRALLRCCYGQALGKGVRVEEPRKEWVDWLHATDENSFTGHGIYHVVKMWSIACRPDLYADAKEQHRELVQFGLRHVGLDQKTTSILMVLPYSFYFAAFTAEDEPKGGPSGKYVAAALLAIRFVDPSGWVPRLLLGLELADPTAGSSFVVGSKQEAMATCRLLSRCWFEAMHRQDVGRTAGSSKHRARATGARIPSALQRLVAEFGLAVPARASTTMRKVARFNNFREVDGPLDQDPLGAPERGQSGGAADPDERLNAVRALFLYMAVLGDATHNLPQLQLNSDGWAVFGKVLPLVGCDSLEDLRDMLEGAVCLPSLALLTLDRIKQQLAIDDARMVEVDKWERMVPTFRPCQLRWLWQAGKAWKALQFVKAWLQEDPQVSHALLDVSNFLLREVGGRQCVAKDMQAKSSAASSSSTPGTTATTALDTGGSNTTGVADQQDGTRRNRRGSTTSNSGKQNAPKDSSGLTAEQEADSEDAAGVQRPLSNAGDGSSREESTSSTATRATCTDTTSTVGEGTTT